MLKRNYWLTGMLPILLVFSLLLISCAKNGSEKKKEMKNADKKNQAERALTVRELYEKNRQIFILDDQLDKKSEAKIDMIKFNKEMTLKFPPSAMLRLFGPGLHNFYLYLYISNGSLPVAYSFSNYIYLTPDGGNLRRVFPEEHQVKRIFTLNYKQDLDDLFIKSFNDENHIFKAAPGMIKDKTVNSIKIFEVTSGVNESGSRTLPWTISEVDLKRFRPRSVNNNFDRNDFLTGAFSEIVGAYDALRSNIKYPEEAKTKKVEGRVVMEAYVDEKGNLAASQLLKGIGAGCDEEALNALGKVKFYPIKQKSHMTIPVDFELDHKAPEYDLTSREFGWNKGRANNLFFSIINQGEKPIPINDYIVSVYIDGEMAFWSSMNASLKPGCEGKYFFGWKGKPGIHEYTIYLDTENKLKESNRSNNTVKGRFRLENDKIEILN